MAVILKPNKAGQRAVFIHIPQTGGTWIRKNLEILDLVEEEVFRDPDNIEPGFGYKTTHNVPIQDSRFAKAHKEGRVFASIRHPFDWYKSYFGYRQLFTWDQTAFDQTCKSETFSGFIENMMKSYPIYGIYDKLVHTIAPYINKFAYTTNLSQHFMEIMSDFGYDVRRRDLIKERVNESKTDDFQYEDEHLDYIIESNMYILRQFRFIDMNALQEHVNEQNAKTKKERSISPFNDNSDSCSDN